MAPLLDRQITYFLILVFIHQCIKEAIATVYLVLSWTGRRFCYFRRFFLTQFFLNIFLLDIFFSNMEDNFLPQNPNQIFLISIVHSSKRGIYNKMNKKKYIGEQKINALGPKNTGTENKFFGPQKFFFFGKQAKYFLVTKNIICH